MLKANEQLFKLRNCVVINLMLHAEHVELMPHARTFSTISTTWLPAMFSTGLTEIRHWTA